MSTTHAQENDTVVARHTAMGEGPCALWQAPNGDCYVAEEFGHSVAKYDAQFTLCWRIGTEGSAAGEFRYPSGIVGDAVGRLYVTDRWNHRVQILDYDGKVVGSFGTYGSHDGQLIEPWGIACAVDGRLLVVDRGNARVNVYEADGRYLSHFGDCGTSAAFYESNRFKRGMHYCDWVQHASRMRTVETFFYEGKFIIGNIEYPEGIAVLANGDIVVTDRASESLVVFDGDYRLKKMQHGFSDGSAQCTPCVVAATPSGVCVADEAAGVIALVSDTGGTRIVDVGSQHVKISGIYYSVVDTALYVCDAWHNTILVLDGENL